MPGSAAAIWAAVAASFSALSSFLIMRIQRRTFVEAARPELVLSGWGRPPRVAVHQRETVTFATIRNVGKGPALNVVINAASPEGESAPTYEMTTAMLPILAAGESQDVNAEIVLHWQNLRAAPDGHKHLFVKVEILCWDARNLRHETSYTLVVAEHKATDLVPQPVAPGVGVPIRSVTSTPVWLLKVRRTVGRGRNTGTSRWVRLRKG